ncbi:hypothetical protein Ddye_024408 [Dipteronia dyeriana]|uniref:Sugar transporter SWEET1 n=1 Tax=Dipteronia dyeriana TaxID=168575 RepID=A0AAD9WUE9_9ROSI|nr:hypothetical protein Ddye_024408 [Dipteronia dyeriana]
MTYIQESFEKQVDRTVLRIALHIFSIELLDLSLKLVIKSSNVEFMPSTLSLSTFLMSLSFFVYGMLKDDPFIYVPNGIGTILGIVQLMLYSYYSSKSGGGSREPLLDSCA